jgi:hypothetical protein
MNKKRLTKTVTFLILGAVSFVPLIFWHDIVLSFLDEKSNLKTLNLVHKIGKAVFIVLGIIFLIVGIYQLIMMFTEEEGEIEK